MTAPAATPASDEPSAAPAPLPVDASSEEGWGWTGRQRIGLASLLLALLVFLVVGYLRRPSLVNDPVVVLHGKQITLPGRIDPNTATVEELTRIPHLGDALAAKILSYRNARQPLAADGIVFREPSDLEHIPGLGKKTAELLIPYLDFPGEHDPEPPH